MKKDKCPCCKADPATCECVGKCQCGCLLICSGCKKCQGCCSCDIKQEEKS
jgi:hypothetical protein